MTTVSIVTETATKVVGCMTRNTVTGEWCTLMVVFMRSVGSFLVFFYCFSLQGQWRANRYHGDGSLFHASGIIYEGLWIDGYPESMSLSFSVIPSSSLSL